MRPAYWLVLLRLLAVVAIGSSAALFVDYANPSEASFCGAGSGCEDVRRSGFSYFGHRFLNIPLVGLVAFGTVLYASLQRGKWVYPLAYLGAAVALVLLAYQAFSIGRFCWLCVVVDVSAIGMAVAGYLHQQADDADDPDPFAVWTWPSVALLVVLAAALWPQVKPQPAVHAKIRAYYEPGKINVVEFSDFECPFCRRLHPILAKLKKEYGDRVNFVRLNFPLPRHTQARFAARSSICADQQGKGNEMAHSLFEAELLDPESNRKLAEEHDLDLAKYDACVADPKIDEQIDTETQILKDAGLQGLPTTYIGNQKIVGVRAEAAFRDAFESATKEEGGGVPPFVFWPLAFAGAGALAFAGRRREPKKQES